MGCVPSRPTEQQALETTESVLAALADVPERDAAIDRLIAAIVRERVQLLAAIARRAAPGRLRAMSYPEELARR
jgi:hypothetical protein